MNGYRKRQLATLLVVAPAIVGLLFSTGSASADPTVSSKRADAQRAMAEINQMDQQLDQVGNAWEGAKVHYSQTTTKLNSTRVTLGIARKSLAVSRHALAKRVISVYMDQGNASDSTVAILFEATSLQNMIDRIEVAQRISDHDAEVVKQVTVFSKQVAAQAVSLERLQTKQREYLAKVTAEKDALQAKLAERKAYVKKVKNQIASLLAEQQRQARLAAERARATVRYYSSPSYTPPPAPTGSIPPSAIGTAVVQAAMTKLGRPYVWGAAGPDYFDCSGLVVWSFAQAGMPGLPHYTGDLIQMGVGVSYNDLEPGDLIFFYGGSHVGIYIGGGQFIQAPHTGDVVKVSSLSGGYSGAYYAARRIG